jgi:hypothetical protein
LVHWNRMFQIKEILTYLRFEYKILDFSSQFFSFFFNKVKKIGVV